MAASIRGVIPSNSFTKNNLPCLDTDHQRHLERAQCHASYKGPVHIVETIYVPCGWCGTPVDPVARVPVGRMFFHPHCLRCVVCGKLGSRTLPFAARQGQPVCMSCDRNKSVPLPPARAAAMAERAKASIGGVGALRALMERSATRSPTRRGHTIEMQQLAAQQRDPNILLISAEKQHELDSHLHTHRAQSEASARGAVSVAFQQHQSTQLMMLQHRQQTQQTQQQQRQQIATGQEVLLLPQKEAQAAPPSSGRRALRGSVQSAQRPGQ